MSEFRRIHPVAKIVFFAVLFLVVMLSGHPFVRVLSFVFAALALAVSEKEAGSILRTLLGGIGVILLLGPVNCIISHQGSTVLFRVFRTAITWEAFFYGISAGVMIVGTMLWCLFITDGTDTDDLVFTAGKVLPRLSAVITVTLRYIPEIVKKFRETMAAQKMLGVFDGQKFQVKVAVSSKVFMSVVERSIEESMDTAAAMRARGFDLKGRSSAQFKKWKEEDTFVVIVTAVCGAGAIIGDLLGLMKFEYYPVVAFSFAAGDAALCMVYAALFALPAVIALDGRMKWRKSFR